jgi:hypothetical protein
MTPLRASLFRNAMWAMLLIAAALLPRALVPAGYMPDSGARSFSVMLCNSASGETVRVDIRVDAPASGHEKGQPGTDHPCAFGALASMATGGADAVLLEAALLHIIFLGFAPVVAPDLQGFFHLRPPLRGPPALS